MSDAWKRDYDLLDVIYSLRFLMKLFVSYKKLTNKRKRTRERKVKEKEKGTVRKKARVGKWDACHFVISIYVKAKNFLHMKLYILDSRSEKYFEL